MKMKKWRMKAKHKNKSRTRSCENCSAQAPYNNGLLFWVVTFDSGDVGNNEFKFNATDNTSYETEAGNPSTTNSITNECVDGGNDCVFVVEAEAEAASGKPVLTNETVNAVTSGVTEGWGSNWNFSVNISNPEGSFSEINLTLLLNTTGTFVDWGNLTCDAPCASGEYLSFYITNLTCIDISAAQYKYSSLDIFASISHSKSATGINA